MGTTHVVIVLFLACINLPMVRSVTCLWPGSVESEGACFLYNNTAVTYSEAKSACQSIGGVLAKVKSRTQLLGITTLPKDDSVWIGANDIRTEGTWVWEVDGSVATELYGLWARGQPYNGTGENCADVYKSEIWDDLCNQFYYFLCMEKDLTTTPDPVTSACTTNDLATTNTAECTTDTSATTNNAASTTDTRATTNNAASTTDTSATTNNAASTTDTRATTNTAASTTDTSATTNNAASTTDTSATTNTAAATTDTSATTNTAASTTDTRATINNAASTTDTSASTNTAASTTATRATTNTAASTTDTSASTNTAASTTGTTVARSTPQASTTPITTSKENGANGIHFNVLFIVHFFAFIYLVI